MSNIDKRVEPLNASDPNAGRDGCRAFYQQYSTLRVELFEHLCARNVGRDQVELLRAAQRLLDAALFTAMSSAAGEPYALAGGLFAPDPLLDGLVIDDGALDQVVALGAFGSDPELGVRLLGYCFEQSAADLEELRQEIQQVEVKRQRQQRQREGIFYTPAHITEYIVEATLGGWLAEQRAALGLDLPTPLGDAELGAAEKKCGAAGDQAKHVQLWQAYRHRLARVRIIDPACGSGVFLVAAFDRLRREAEAVQRQLGRVRGGQPDGFDDIDSRILSNNLFGIDINTRAVQITQLSLWLRSGKAKESLTALDRNIRVGNSLVDDPSVVPDAFLWDEQFAGGFDVIVGNPPYDVLSALETGKTDLRQLRAYFKKHPVLARSFGGKQNLYKLFVCRMIAELAAGGRLGAIVPMALLGDMQATGVRKYLFETCSVVSVDAFPQKDDPHKRVFSDAKLATCIAVARQGAGAEPFRVRTHPGRRLETPWSRGLVLTKDQVKRMDAQTWAIPTCTRQDWAVAEKVLAHPQLRRLGDVVKSYQGEVNETNVRKRGSMLTTDETLPLVLRGSNITMYAVRAASQGAVFHIDDAAFIEGKKPGSKAFDYQQRRVGFQRSSPQNNFRRIIAAPIAPGLFCFDTVSYVTERSSTIDLDALLALLNSRLFDFYFRLSSSNSKVNEYQFNNLPFLALDNDHDPQVEQWVAAGDWAQVVGRVRKAGQHSAAPGWIEWALASLARAISALESERLLERRRERSRLGAPSQKLQRRVDQMVYGMFGLDERDAQHVERRLGQML